MAKQIADQSPRAVRAAKRLMNETRSVAVAEALKLESEVQAALVGGPDQREAMLARQEHRPARFADITEQEAALA